MEKRAHSALGLQGQAPFIAIIRLRRLHGEPRALHRAYLDPARFARNDQNFLKDHDFGKESLIRIYQDLGYDLSSRDTVLTARFPNLDEENLMRAKGLDVHLQPVLDAEQHLFAVDPTTGQPFVLECLQATYFGHWHYEVKNRPAASKSA